MKYHPDRNEGDQAAAEKFKEYKKPMQFCQMIKSVRRTINLAMRALIRAWAAVAAPVVLALVMLVIFSDIFGDIFGGGGGGHSSGGPRAQRGADLAYEMELTLEEAVQGITKEISLTIESDCDSCHGSGAKKGSKPVRCSTCNGTGQVRMQHGFMAIQQTCRDCGGTGQVIKDPCLIATVVVGCQSELNYPSKFRQEWITVIVFV